MEGNARNDAPVKIDGRARGASCSDTSTEGHRVAILSGYDYEVFLSFRGKDTRAGFTDFLYTSLIDAGIHAYKDDQEIPKGEEFGPKLLQAINESKISIPIFSKGYASSAWCLKELVKMVECQKTRGQKIMPIFYDVSPSEVRYQTGGYEKAFLSHENKKRYDEDTMRDWRAALSAVGALDGWDLQSIPNRREGEFAKTLTQQVFNELKKAYLVVSDYLVSVDHHVDEIMEKIGAQTSETRIVELHGMGGIGKTTIAKIVYNKLSNNFKSCCFLSNIREMSKLKGIEYLQNRLMSDILKSTWTDIRNIDEGTQTIKDRLSNKRVLILFDDADEKNHMDALVGKHDWFGKGSKLILTTRKKGVLDVPEVDFSYEVNSMDHDKSLQLFSKHAFRRDYPIGEYINQSKKVVDIAGGLPLALEVIGSLLSRTEKEMWDVTLEKLENVPHAEVQRKLKISYDALDVQQKHIFLDIACLFIGYDKDNVIYFWDKSKLFPEEAMEVLQNMSLIKIGKDNEVWIHDQLRDLGREMIRQESNMKIGKQSRVWNPEEALDLVMSQEEKEKVESLRLKFDHQQQYCFTHEDFMRLPNLKLLEVDGLVEKFSAEGRHVWHKLLSNVLPTNVCREYPDLLPQLRWLSWHNIPPKFNITYFSMKNVVILDLYGSEITHDWKGWSHMKVIKNLKVLNLTRCICLERTPNFSAHANLEHLILWDCSKLVEIDKSICQLKCLVSLDVRYCWKLQRLPDELGALESLKELLIDSTLIEEIPNCQGLMNLRIFTASGLFPTVKYLHGQTARSLKRLPTSIGNWKLLIELDISRTMVEELPDSIGNLKNLKVMKMTGSSISKIPNAFWTMEKLEAIEARNNPLLSMKIGNDIYKIPSLRILSLDAKIYAVSRLPESLISLHLSTVYMKTFPDLSNLINLKELYLSFIASASNVRSYDLGEDPMPWWIGKLSKLKSLSMYFDYMTTLPTDVSLLPKLEELYLARSNLCCLPRLPSSLLSLVLSDCRSLCLMDLSNLKKLLSLEILSSAISEIQGLDCLENLQYLQLFELGHMKILPDLSNLKKLRTLQVQTCNNLVEIQGELPQSLEVLDIRFCESLQKLPDWSSLKGLRYVETVDRN